MKTTLRAISILAAMVATVASMVLIHHNLIGNTCVAAASSHDQGRISGRVSIHAVGPRSPLISVGEGRDILTHFGGDAGLQRSLEAGEARALALASADFDEDGVPDLVGSYSRAGAGIVTLYRGNSDSIYPYAEEARQRTLQGASTESPFLSEVLTAGIPVAADFVGAGDFDGDGHWDVVGAARSGRSLYLLRGDGRGGFQQAQNISLPGEVTALAVGEMNRRDGLDDVVVAIKRERVARLLVFEGPQGALRARPEEIELPAEATSLSFGKFDGDSTNDLAVAAGRELIVVYGRDRKLSLDPQEQLTVEKPALSVRSFPYAIRDMAVGSFTGTRAASIALLSDDGGMYVLTNVDDLSDRKRDGAELMRWQSQAVSLGAKSNAKRLLAARVSSAGFDDLILVDSANRQLQVVATELGSLSPQTQAASAHHSTASSTMLEADGEIAAVLPMRLNQDALSDLMILKSGSSPLAMVKTQAQSAFMVTNTGDEGSGSLRQAILDANAAPGPDLITFQIPGSNVPRIAPISPLPDITDPVTIDGTTQSAGKVELTGAQVQFPQAPSDGRLAIGLRLKGGNSTVRGLVINSFLFRKEEGDSILQAGGCIYLADKGGNIIEGNFIGTDVGTTQWLSGNSSVLIYPGSAGNLIGGTTAAARNVILGSVHLLYDGGNIVQGNFIGTNSAGTASVEGVDPRLGTIQGSSVGLDSPGNLLGGTTAGARNIIAGGAGMSDGLAGPGTPAYPHHVYGNLIQGNYIGTDVTGTKALGGSVTIQDSPDNTIGGTTPAARNIISGAKTIGIKVLSTPDTSGGTLIQGNYIGTDKSGTLPIGNNLDGVSPKEQDPFRPFRGGVCIIANPALFAVTLTGKDIIVGGAIPEARNVISASETHGLVITGPVSNDSGRIGIRVQGNYIGTDASGKNPMGNKGDGIFVGSRSVQCKIDGNLIAFNGDSGINIPDPPGDKPGLKIAILSNSIHANQALGIDLGSPGVTENDAMDADTGANELQNFPILSSANSFTEGIMVTGGLNAAANTACTIQFFSGKDRQGHQLVGEPILIGEGQVTTNKDGNANFSFTFDAASELITGWVNATATDASGNTSEFSDCLQIAKSDCKYSLSALTAQAFKAIGGTGAVHVAASRDCGWTAASNADWLTISSSDNGKGNGIVTFSVGATTAATLRTGTLRIGGQTFTVKQIGTGPAILEASVKGKKLFIDGGNFDEGASILINGETQKTLNDGDSPADRLIGKKSGKKVKAGDTLRVQNSNGAVSQEFTFSGS